MTMTPKDSLRMMVKAYPGGYAAMAPRIGKTPEVLRKELSDSESFKLGLETAQLISEICIEANTPNCRAYVTAVAADSGALLQLPVYDQLQVHCIPGAVSLVMKELSDVTSETMQALGDGFVSDNEMARIRTEAMHAVSALQALLAACDAVNKAGKPKGAQ